MKIFSVILARGGSKGIPNKNLVDINGHPLIYYSIKSSLLSNCDETWVSTDCKAIKDASLSLGASVLDRPTELATDTSTSESALIHFCKNVDCDYVVFIQPTSPLLSHVDINKGISLITSPKCDSVISCYEEEWCGKWTHEPALATLPAQFRAVNYINGKRPRRQDVKYPLYIENGAFYISKREDIIREGNRFSGTIDKIVMPFIRSFQIDTTEDLDLIRKIML